jgi:hypothetical protein
MKMSELQQSEIQALILKFAEDHLITLLNLIESEEILLAEYIKSALAADFTEQNQQILLDKLQSWLPELKHAVHRKGVHIDDYAAQVVSFANTLLKTGTLSADEWGSDLDIVDCLGEANISDYKKIAKPGIHILRPETDQEVDISYKIQEAMKAIIANDVTGHVSLRMILGNSIHWRLAKLEIKNKKIISVTLWEPIRDHESIQETESYINLKAAIRKIEEKEIPTFMDIEVGKQSNGYSCMDYCIQEAIKGTDISPSISAAGPYDSMLLRQAVVKQIVANKIGINAAKNIKLKNNAFRIAQPDLDAFKEQKQSLVEWLGKNNDKALQENFDASFARNLQELYNKECKAVADEKTLEAEAFTTTVLDKEMNEKLKCYGWFFKPYSKEVITAIEDKTETLTNNLR